MVRKYCPSSNIHTINSVINLIKTTSVDGNFNDFSYIDKKLNINYVQNYYFVAHLICFHQIFVQKKIINKEILLGLGRLL